MNQTNWKYILIVIILASIVGGGVYFWQQSILERIEDVSEWQKNELQQQRDKLQQQIEKLTEEPERYVEIVFPNGGESFCLGEDIIIKWENKGLEIVVLYISNSQGTSYPLGAYPADFNDADESGWGVFVWKVGTTSGGVNLQEGHAWTIRINSSDNPEINDSTNGAFSILQCKG